MAVYQHRMGRLTRRLRRQASSHSSGITGLLLLAQTQVQQRIRLPKPIMVRSPDHLEALLEVKTQGLGVLFVDVQFIGVHVFDRVAQQLPAQPLATVARVVQRHGGRIQAEGAVGEGACFSFSLPVEPQRGFTDSDLDTR